MYIQIYIVHLHNGQKYEAIEDYDLQPERGLITKFKKAAEDEVICINVIGMRVFVQKKNILLIEEGAVKELRELGSED